MSDATTRPDRAAALDQALVEATYRPTSVADALGALQGVRSYLRRVRDREQALGPVLDLLCAYVDADDADGSAVGYAYEQLAEAVAVARAQGWLPAKAKVAVEPPPQAGSAVAAVASAMAVHIIDERLREGARIEIPSLGIVIEKREGL